MKKRTMTMAFKATDLKCLNKKCGNVWEELIDSRNPDEKFTCPKCQKTKYEAVGISLGTGSKKHISWSKWSV